MNKEKIIIIIVSAIGVFVLLAGILFLNSFLDKRNISLKTESLKNSEVEKQQLEQEEASSSAPEISENKEVNAADVKKIKDMIIKEMEDSRKIPSKDISDAFKDVAACAELKDGADRDACVIAWAVYKNDPNLCQGVEASKLQDCRDKALVAKAEFDKNISLCADVADGSLKISCISRVIQEAGLSEQDCSLLPANESKICLTRLMLVKVKTIDDCGSIADSAIKQTCQNNFYPSLKD